MSIDVGVGRVGPPTRAGARAIPITTLVGCIVSVGMGVSQGVVGPALIGMRAVLGDTAPGWVVPVLINSGAVVGMLALRPLGRIAHLGHVMSVCTAVVAASLLCIGLVRTPALLIVALLGFGVSFGVIAMGWNTTLVGDGSAPRAHGLANAMFGVGILIGPLVYRAIAGTDARNHRPVYLAVGGAWVVLGVIAHRAKAALREVERRGAERHALHGPLAVDQRTRVPLLPATLWVVAALLALGGVVEATAASFMEDQLRAVGVQGTSVWKSGFWVSYTLSRLAVAVLAARHGAQRLYTTAVAVGLGVAVVGMVSSGAPLSLVALGLAVGPLFPLAFVLGVRRGAQPRQITALMLCGMLGGAVGPVFTGPALEQPGTRTMAVMMLVLFALMLSVLWVDAARRPRY